MTPEVQRVVEVQRDLAGLRRWAPVWADGYPVPEAYQRRLEYLVVLRRLVERSPATAARRPICDLAALDMLDRVERKRTVERPLCPRCKMESGSQLACTDCGFAFPTKQEAGVNTHG